MRGEPVTMNARDRVEKLFDENHGALFNGQRAEVERVILDAEREAMAQGMDRAAAMLRDAREPGHRYKLDRIAGDIDTEAARIRSGK